MEQLQKLPWLVLLLIKWVLLDGQYPWSDKKQLNDRGFNQMLEMMRELGNIVRMPDKYEHLTLFFRNLSYQQFSHQKDFSFLSFAGQKVLFDSGDHAPFFRNRFLDLTGLKIGRFLELALALCSYFMDRRAHTISSKSFSTMKPNYTEDEIHSLLDAISLDLEGHRSELLKSERQESREYEFYEMTPFLRFPFIRDGNSYLCIYPSVLFRTLEHFIYDRLRAWNPSRFMDKFGKVFEKYVEKGISYTGIPYANEDTLKSELAGTGKVVDFLINDGDTNIFLDAKGVEMPYKGKVTHRPKIVKNKVRDSVIKAIEQSFDVLRRLQNTQSKNPVIKHREENYLLVVTFKEMYLGNGRSFYEAIAKDKLHEISEKHKDSPRIPFENMYFITVREFDLFVQLIKSGKISFAEGLRKAKESDSKPETSKFEFILHLSSWDNKLEMPCYVREESDRMFQSIGEAVKDQS